ncbi:MotE family protein [Paracoccus sp. SCSIO 75233]|uniref:MotE family protein n=1 Tax=Paracoccus sp. SCSIO 75233 TaxID=3017782 RepID=UPI0022F0DD90|nr:hypothetical protein [Paracoccus sp. SCSIO 75233]WBU53134.1 hypothetical protein PAF12_15155 [Paracoccus sp. SCSIO 75233]
MPRLFGLLLLAGMLPVAALSLSSETTEQPVPEAGGALLAGCGDVPEVVALVHELRIREARIHQALGDLDRRRVEITAARETLKAELTRLKAASDGVARSRSHRDETKQDDIARMVAIYESMKPKDAAKVISGLPETYSAEILMRLSPETGARIMAAIDPQRAAILTTYMGARSVTTQ